MTGRAKAILSALSLGALATYGAASCLDETTTTSVVVATGTPTISIHTPTDGACVALTGGKEDFIGVTVLVDNFYLRPPGACEGLGNCGHLRLDVDGVYNNASSSQLINVIFEGKIGNHLGDKTLTVTLVDDAGKEWLQSTDGDAGADAGPNGPFKASVTIVGKTSCSSATSSSASTSSSSASTGTGGTGGGGTGGGGTGGAPADAGADDAGDGG